ncbi:nuclear transport factor 2 family protein [Sphingobium lactosutens]|uniref:nuclear transport factor 2 family protein n=1 Tax=Sphingobium lactosutens TaxID=522773 RepID=UPI0015C19F38|nr:nuclear transport factor 2 family protein [Sphingobium lactosutens]NWK97913.1 nuclear transport factor 2 family protein [Sphingobium lactosutens]
MTPQEMLAREAIRYTLELYNRAADTAHYALHHQVFHPDALFEVQGKGELKGPDTIIAMLHPAAEQRGAFEKGNFQRHNLTTTMIEFAGPDSAQVVTYIIVVTELGIDHSGRYDDEFVRSGDRWLIMRRHATMEWARPDSRFTRWLGQATPVESSGE